jgi:hypothetical protein
MLQGFAVKPLSPSCRLARFQGLTGNSPTAIHPFSL